MGDGQDGAKHGDGGEGGRKEDTCEDLKKRYEKCFNHWYTEEFLKGQLEPKCQEEFEEYRDCVVDKMQKKNLGRVLEAATSAQTKQQ
eukprot:jgi/Pico_ML_1/50586/g1771.t1